MFSIIKQVGIINFIKAGINELHRKIVREYINGSYAQDYEDLEIEKNMGKKIGYYVEIGAYHPTRISNTYRFYKKGWKGIVVEPNPNIKSLFEKIRSRDRFVNIGVGTKNGQIKYYMYDIPALNTFSKKQTEINRKNGFVYSETKNIEIVDIELFLKQNIDRSIDLLSLDVEGWDEKILNRWNWTFKPKVICVENPDVKELLTNQGYKFKQQTRYNSIYVL